MNRPDYGMDIPRDPWWRKTGAIVYALAFVWLVFLLFEKTQDKNPHAEYVLGALAFWVGLGIWHFRPFWLKGRRVMLWARSLLW